MGLTGGTFMTPSCVRGLRYTWHEHPERGQGDEDLKEVFAAFDAAQKGRTAPSRDWGAPSTWSTRLRLEIAAVLRRLAKAIKSSRVSIP
jgi:hypothetical protein